MKDFNSIFLSSLLSRRYSDCHSFCIKNEYYSYKQLFDYAEQIYAIVDDLNDESIAIYADDDIRTYAGILALWYAGKAYVPLNPLQPKERHREIIESVGCSSVISSSEKYNLDINGIQFIYTARITDKDYICKKPISVIRDVPDTKLAYILFTSGSTGKPKGVQISRGNLAAFIDSMDNIGLDISREDRCLQPFDLSFDFSVSSYVIPLAKGATIYTIPRKVTKFIYIASLLEKYHLTVLQMVPSMIRNLLPYIGELKLSSVKYNILCGEALTGKVIAAWHLANPEMVSYNMYGPTEDTVFCTYYPITKQNINNLLVSNDIISIGTTFKNNKLLLLDENNQIIQHDNAEGELCLSGEQLTPGYWKNEMENACKFFLHNGERYYRTGDICYYSKGVIMYVNRKDFQIKINGFRVELGEIENRFNEISGGRFSVVIPFLNVQNNTELAIVIEGDEYDYKDHKNKLSQLLPSYEIPSRWLFIQSIPLNANGKIDRKRIKETFKI